MTNRQQFQLSDEELKLIKEIRERAHRVLLTPEEIRLIEDRRRENREAQPKKDWKQVKKVCPHCKKTKLVVPDFGLHVVRGKEYATGWCSQCRSETAKNYQRKPRKYRTVNGSPSDDR